MKTKLRNAPLRNVIIAALFAISLILFSIAILERHFMAQTSHKMAVLSHSAQQLQEGAGDIKYIVANTQRLALTSMLTADQDMLLLAPAQSERCYNLIEEMKRLLDDEDSRMREKLDRLKKDYRNFLFKVIGVASQYIERTETDTSVLADVNTWTEDFIGRLTTIAEEISQISKQKNQRIDAYSKNIQIINIISFVAVMAVMFLLAFMMEWKLFKPLNILMAFVREITGSDSTLAKRIDNKSRDEIGELGRSLNFMLDSLNQTTVSRNRLRQEVAERRRAEGALRQIKEHLEDEVRARTMAMQKSYKELKHEISVRKQAKLENDQLAAQLLQIQKMDAIGTLASGVAHDFNNILTSIIGFAELAVFDLPNDSPERCMMLEIVKLGQRGAELTNQLLTFSRQQASTPSIIDLKLLMTGMLNMLNRLIGENIKLNVRHSAENCRIKIDPGQVEQLLMNLVINARDAMPTGGTITIESSQIRLEKGLSAAGTNIVPGTYIKIAVSDTGCGMDKRTLEKMFEPFFTTKPNGKGTGLGLLIVYGVVKNNRGVIKVASKIGQGSCFEIFFPQAVEPVTEARLIHLNPGANASNQQQCKSILLVEDELDVLESTKNMLESMGHHVTSFHDPVEAELAFKTRSFAFDLLISDVVMPNLDGPELYARLISVQPDLKAIFMSGYAQDHIPNDIIKMKNTMFVQKPFSIYQLNDIISAFGNHDQFGGDQNIEKQRLKAL